MISINDKHGHTNGQIKNALVDGQETYIFQVC